MSRRLLSWAFDLACFVVGCGYGLAGSVFAMVVLGVSPRAVLVIGVGLAVLTILVGVVLWTRLTRSHGLYSRGGH